MVLLPLADEYREKLESAICLRNKLQSKIQVKQQKLQILKQYIKYQKLNCERCIPNGLAECMCRQYDEEMKKKKISKAIWDLEVQLDICVASIWQLQNRLICFLNEERVIII